MTNRVDNHGHLLRVGDLVRLPSGREGWVHGFARTGDRERVIVRYEDHELDEVTLLPHLLERLPWKPIAAKRKERRRQMCRPTGYLRGEAHYRARLSDQQVRHMRELHRRSGKGYQTLAAISRCGVSTARDICTLRTRRDA